MEAEGKGFTVSVDILPARHLRNHLRLHGCKWQNCDTHLGREVLQLLYFTHEDTEAQF